MPRVTRKRAAQTAPEPEPEIEEEQVEEAEAEESHDAQPPGQQGNDEMDVEEDVEEGDEEDSEREGRASLENDAPLTWKAGRPIAVATLLQRLKALAAELQSLAQHEVIRAALVPKAKELASPLLLGHKDYGIKIYTVRCVVEMFRLFAPHQPYKPSQLKEIFNFVVSTVIPGLSNPAHTYNTEHEDIIKSLAEIQSIVLLPDLPGSDQLQTQLFSNCFDVLAGNVSDGDKELLSMNVEYMFTSLLCTLVFEADAVHHEIVEVILAQFLRADPKATKKKGEARFSEVLRDVSPAYSLARSICNTCHEKMTRHIGEYFQAVLIDASEARPDSKPAKPKAKRKMRDDSDDESESGLIEPSADELQEAEKAHSLLRELWRSCPAVIQNILPQVESELSTENTPLRIMGVESVGDMIAGIGAAGPPPPSTLDPAAYPSQSLSDYQLPAQQNIVLIPAAPQAFSSTHPTTYQSFIDRHRDKSAQVRAVWATACARIILTSGGGKGLDSAQESQLLQILADLITDNDKRVRFAAVAAVATFDFQSIVRKLGSHGGAAKEGSILYQLASRIKDPEESISATALELLGKIWGVASGAIIEGNEHIRELLGPIPSSIFNAMYINQPKLNALIARTIIESLLPLSYPPTKGKAFGEKDSQRVPDSQSTQSKGPDPDRIRAERILALVRDLDAKAKAAFFGLQGHQVSRAKYVSLALALTEKLEGAAKGDTAEAKNLQKIIAVLADRFPDKVTAVKHLTTFFGFHDRRNFALTRFAIAADSDFKKSRNALIELLKRLSGATSNIASSIDTVRPLLFSAAVLVYNRSHVPAIVTISRTDENGLGSAAHDVLKEISTHAPLVFEVHIKELCETLKKQAPSASSSNDPTTEDTLKACAGFARQFPEKMPKDREFYQAMAKFAKFGSPPTVAKHAVTVIVAAAEKKDMYVSDILKYCLANFDVSEERAATRLASISQLLLLAHVQTEDHADAIHEILTGALVNRSSAEATDATWTDEVDGELRVKLWALKGVVNNIRGQLSDADTTRLDKDLEAAIIRTFKVLNTIIHREGELAGELTPEHHKAHMRLAAAKLILKLCCDKPVNKLFAAQDFNRLTTVAQDVLMQVRSGFVTKLKKYTGQQKQLHHRFFSLMFLYAFEPIKALRESTATHLKARAAFYAKAGVPMMENVFPYFLSLLAHHQDFSPSMKDLPDFIEYIIFYLKAVGNEQNLSDIYAYAQRARSFEDAIEPDNSENLWTMADLAEAIIRAYEQTKGWSLQLKSSKPSMPSSIYRHISDHQRAEEVSQKRFLPEELDDTIEQLVGDRLRPKKKRKHTEGESKRPVKKARATNGDEESLAVRKKKVPKEPKPKPAKSVKKRASDAVPSSAMRKSTRVSNAHSYVDPSDSEQVDDDDIIWRYEAEGSDEEADKENVGSSTPPTSDPLATSKSQEEVVEVADEDDAESEVVVDEPVAKTNGTKERTPRTKKKTPTSKAAKSKAAPPKKAAAATKQQPARGTRASTRGATKREKDTMDIASESDGELSAMEA